MCDGKIMNNTQPEISKYIKYLFKKSVVDVIPNKNKVVEVLSENDSYNTSDNLFFYKVKIVSSDILQDKYRVDNNEVSDYTIQTSKKIIDVIKKSTNSFVLNSNDGILLNGNIKIKTNDPTKIEIIADEVNNEIIINSKVKRFEYTSYTKQNEYYIFHGLNTFDLNVEILVFDENKNQQKKEIVYYSFPNENFIYIKLFDKKRIKLYLSQV